MKRRPDSSQAAVKTANRNNGKTLTETQKAAIRVADLIWSPDSAWTGPEVLCAQAVLRHLGANETAWPGLTRIAKVGKVSRSTAQRCMRVLVNGDPKRDLPPVFTRKSRGEGRGYNYAPIGNADELVKGREKNAKRTAALTAVAKGQRFDGPRPELPADLAARAEELRKARQLAEADFMLNKISETERTKIVRQADRELAKIAREAAKRKTEGTKGAA